jgi:hypothetical protein
MGLFYNPIPAYKIFRILIKVFILLPVAKGFLLCEAIFLK